MNDDFYNNLQKWVLTETHNDKEIEVATFSSWREGTDYCSKTYTDEEESQLQLCLCPAGPNTCYGPVQETPTDETS